MAIAGEGCFGLGEPCHARYFPCKGFTMEPQDVYRALGGLQTSGCILFTLHLLTSFMSFFRSFDAENSGS